MVQSCHYADKPYLFYHFILILSTNNKKDTQTDCVKKFKPNIIK